MGEAVYVRFSKEELRFINNMAEEEKITRSDAIKKLVDFAAERLKIKNAVTKYKEGNCTIREAAEKVGMRYFTFFDILAKKNLIGTDPRNTELLIRQLEE